MRLAVSHRTVYRYARPSRFVVQSHRLTPADTESQKVLDWRIAVPGGTIGAAFTDGAGDRVATMTLPGPVETVEIAVTGTVETADTAGVLRGLRETIWPLVYLRPTAATGVDRDLLALRDRALAGAEAAPALDRAHLLSAAIAEAIAYAPGATGAHTTAAEALALGRGVCQDHAHALIAVARAAGLPARYVAGYLFAGPEDEGPHEAAHAWAELHLDGLGWTGFDPANRCCPDARYIRLGSGRDAGEAAPIRGVSLGEAETELHVEVAVADTQSQQQQSGSQRQQ